MENKDLTGLITNLIIYLIRDPIDTDKTTHITKTTQHIGVNQLQGSVFRQSSLPDHILNYT